MNDELRRYIPRRFLRLIAAPWVICLIAGSLMPSNFKDAVGTHSFHRTFHFVSFGSTALLFLLLSNNRRQEYIAACGVFALGVTLEILQHVIFVDIFEWWDVRDDAVGIAIVWVVYRLVERWLASNRAANAPAGL
jgi:hypothetical protein